jgi:hypothetical protein
LKQFPFLEKAESSNLGPLLARNGGMFVRVGRLFVTFAFAIALSKKQAIIIKAPKQFAVLFDC